MLYRWSSEFIGSFFLVSPRCFEFLAILELDWLLALPSLSISLSVPHITFPPGEVPVRSRSASLPFPLALPCPGPGLFLSLPPLHISPYSRSTSQSLTFPHHTPTHSHSQLIHNVFCSSLFLSKSRGYYHFSRVREILSLTISSIGAASLTSLSFFLFVASSFFSLLYSSSSCRTPASLP